MSEKNIVLPITGMTCANCAATIERTVRKKSDGIIDINVAIEDGMAEKSVQFKETGSHIYNKS